MAPALTFSQDPPNYEKRPLDDSEKTHSSQRRALSSVDNIATPMEEEDMGLQHQPNLAKDSQEMEQILVDLGNTDLDQADLLQAIKTLESGGDNLSAGDADAIFPLPGFDLADIVDSEGDSNEDKIKLIQIRQERRCAFLQRRLRILQARAIGKRISEEAALTFEKCIKGARRDGGGRPMGIKALLKRVETTANLQASAASRSIVGPTYYKAGSSKGDASKSASIGIQSGTLAGLEDTAGALKSHLSVVKKELDSDATLSSSGAESNDEAVLYNNPHQQHMPIEKRALWSWQRARASIASRWCWLQAQVQELEYKIRQHNELHKQVREAKGPIDFEGEPVGYEGKLPGSELPDDDPRLETCARHRPLRRETFKKRKLLRMHNLHIATAKAAKPSDIKCSCQYGVESCGVCTGRVEPTQPLAPPSTLSPQQKIALVDPGYHPVLSDVKDISRGLHMSALCSRGWFRSRCSRSWRSSRSLPPSHSQPLAPSRSHSQSHTHTHSHTQSHTATKVKEQSRRNTTTRLKRGRPPLSRKIKEREREEDTLLASNSGKERSRGRPSTESRTSRLLSQSYDIDNIVIPQSVAASTRPEILHYKEILTPKWRVLDVPDVPLNNGVVKSSHRMSVESEEEDMSEASIAQRHTRAEAAERARYVRPRTRRAQDATDATQATNACATFANPPPVAPDYVPQETVQPYSPRRFPLQDITYMDMLSEMPQERRSPPPARSHLDSPPSPSSPPSPGSDPASSLSPLSPALFEGDDPDDVEWEPTSERGERRRTAFR